MKVVILCGGKGTRIADADYDAKALVEIGDKPILWHIMKIYAAQGFSDFVLTLGHGRDAIKQYFLNYEAMTRDFTLELGSSPTITYHEHHEEEGWRITMADTGLETNKGARVARVLRYLDGEPFHLTYGDGVGDVDLNALLAFHRAHGRLMTVTGYQPHSQYGILQLDEDGLVTGFEEKPRLREWINAGFMICEPGIAEYLQGDSTLDLEKEVMVRLAQDRQIMVYRHRGFWRSMDTFKEARELSQIWANGAPWKVW
ncbi:MAG: glucose-1-phosphate cytidylyltransferase [Anaerolineae bacterium]